MVDSSALSSSDESPESSDADYMPDAGSSSESAGKGTGRRNHRRTEDAKVISESNSAAGRKRTRSERPVSRKRAAVSNKKLDKDARRLEKLKMLFKTFDRRGKSFVTVDDVERVVDDYGMDLSRADIRKMVQVYDSTDSSVLWFQDFEKIAEDVKL